MTTWWRHYLSGANSRYLLTYNAPQTSTYTKSGIRFIKKFSSRFLDIQPDCQTLSKIGIENDGVVLSENE